MTQQWKPIESAPKDGSEIWAYNGEQARMRWTQGECYALWIWADDLLSDADPNPEPPTHWMPLPAAPCGTCNGHGLVGGLTQHSGYDAEPCPECSTPPASAQDAQPDDTAVICPGCAHQFRAIPVQVQGLLKLAGYEPPFLDASAQDDAKDERQAFEAWAKKKKMPLARIGEQYDDFWVDHAWNGWQARASVAAPAAGDARMARNLLPKLQSLLDRMANDPHTGTVFEADGDTLRDAMHLCRSVVVDAASQQQEG